MFLSLNGICSSGIDICLVHASRNGHLEVVKYLQQCKKNNDLLISSSSNGDLGSVKHLIEKCHEDVEAKDNGGRTPIIRASYNGHLEVVKYLHEECHANA